MEDRSLKVKTFNPTLDQGQHQSSPTKSCYMLDLLCHLLGNAILLQVLEEQGLCDGSLFQAPLEHVPVFEENEGWKAVHLQFQIYFNFISFFLISVLLEQ